jgi:hypothetical protein
MRDEDRKKKKDMGRLVRSVRFSLSETRKEKKERETYRSPVNVSQVRLARASQTSQLHRGVMKGKEEQNEIQ